MNQPKILTEVNRINKLMGLNLIVESSNIYLTLADDAIKLIGKKASKSSTAAEEALDKLKIARNAANDTEILRELFNLSSLIPELANRLSNLVLKTLTENEKTTIQEFVSFVHKKVREKSLPEKQINSYVDNWVSNNVTTTYPEVKSMIIKNIETRVESMLKKSATVTTVMDKSLADVIPLTDKQVAKLESVYRPTGFARNFKGARRLFTTDVLTMIKSQAKIMDDTLSLIKTFTETTNAAQKSDILKRIGDNLKILVQKDKSNFDIIGEWINMNVNDFTIRNSLKGSNGYKNAAKIFDGTALEEWKKSYSGLSARRWKLLKQINSVLNPASWFGKSISKYGSTSWGGNLLNKWKLIIKGSEFAEIRRYFRFGQTQSPEAKKKYREMFGIVPQIGNVAKEHLYSYVALATVLSLADSTTDIFGQLLRQFGLFKNVQYVADQAKSFDKHFDKAGDIVSTIPFVNKENVVVYGGLKYLLSELLYICENLKDVFTAFPGFIDDTFQVIFKILYYSSNKDSINQEDIKNANQQLEEITNKLQGEMNKLVGKTDSEYANLIDIKGEEIFKNWCKLTGKTPDPNAPWDKNNYIGTTSDGKKWEPDFKNKTKFKEVKPQ